MIPEELRTLKQWCCSTTLSKIPLNPLTKRAAFVDKPGSWGTYQDAVTAGTAYIGFVLSKRDPYVIIDLDDPYSKKKKDGARVYTDEECEIIIARQQKIREHCNGTYEELSKSGRGLHIIGRGSIPSGRNKDEVEVYSSERYMICTGRTVTYGPIKDIQNVVDVLYKEMAPYDEAELSQTEGFMDDSDVFEMAMNASNGDKFDALCKGEWVGEYESQSEADFALLSIIAFYTYDNAQVRRLFRMTALGKRSKATRDDKYIDRCLRKIRAKQPPPVDIEALKESYKPQYDVPEPLVDEKELICIEVPECPYPPKPVVRYPPGLIGVLANYFYRSSVRPVHEVAIASALGMTAGIAGRNYNISNTGLNQYIVMIAKTGSGKEGLGSNIDRFISHIRKKIPVVDGFIGPSVFASGQAVLKVLNEKPCFVSVLGEIGLTLQQICGHNANGADKMLKRVLLDLYTKSGWTSMLGPMVYSDTSKNTELLHAPSVTVLGESTPDAFFDGLDSSLIAEGLIPRFSMIEYDGLRPPKNLKAFNDPQNGLVKQYQNFVMSVLSMQQSNKCCTINMNKDAEELLNEYDRFADETINKASTDSEIQIWNRAHLKALKYAGLIAVGENYHDPRVTKTDAEWAIEFVNADIETIQRRLSQGVLGFGDTRLEGEVRGAILQYMGMDHKAKARYSVPKSILHMKIIPFGFLRRRLRGLLCFKSDRRGAERALKDTLNAMVSAEVLDVIPPMQANKNFNIRSPLYIKGAQW